MMADASDKMWDVQMAGAKAMTWAVGRVAHSAGQMVGLWVAMWVAGWVG